VIGTMIGIWKVHFRHSGRMLCDDYHSREDAIDAACRRWLADPQVWVTGPNGDVVQSAKVERIDRDQHSADKSS
jgi:hypothetical protein